MSGLSSFKVNIVSKLPQSLLTYVLFCVFGIGSWVAINGLWAEISILSLTLPECSCLPAAIVVVIQIANIGPLVYTFVKLAFQRCGYSNKQYHLEVTTVFVLVGVGIASCVCLALFWDKTSLIGDSDHSVSLIVTAFFLALVDCTSSVVFIPFLQHFPSEYISALYIGEGLSGVLPSVVALSQGSVNNSIECLQHYPGHTQLGLNFSPNVFFIFLSIMMILCGLAFLLINILPVVRRQMLPALTNDSPSTDSPEPSQDEESDTDSITPLRGTPITDQEDEVQRSIMPPAIVDVRQKLRVQDGDNVQSWASSDLVLNIPPTHHNSFTPSTVVRVLWSHITIYVCLALIYFLTSGSLNAISPFAFFPYGNEVYHIAVNVALLAAPLMSLLYLFVPHKSPVFTAVLTSLACLLGIYILMVALIKPTPLQSELIGKIIVVCVNVSVSLLVSYAKVGAVAQLHAHPTDKDTALVLAGLVSQLGSLLGAVLFFVLIYYTNIFQSSCG